MSGALGCCFSLARSCRMCHAEKVAARGIEKTRRIPAVPGDNRISQLEEELNHPDLHTRLRALRELKHLADSGKAPIESPKPWVNMHCHTFFSYNARGFSPCRTAWEMFRRGVSVAAMIDFDVLDGIDEAMAASDALLFKFTAGIETRLFVKEFERDVLNSPHEPGIAYYCGQGFIEGPAPKSAAARTLEQMAQCAVARNQAMLERINAYLDDVQIDYEKDVIPLSAAGNATERHMLVAYETAARESIPDPTRRARFWAAKLHMARDETERLMNDSVQFRNVLRKKLMKYGSPGYAAPDPRNFPALPDVVEMIRACGAMPMYAWLDGTNSGEQDAELLIDFFITAGGAGLNIIPDRNWNLKDQGEKALKVAKLNEIIAIAQRRNLPINVGTEINNDSQPLVDRFDSAELKPHVATFLDGARIIWGHSLLLRHGGFGYLSPQAEAAFGNDVRKKNAFFREAGSRPVPHGAHLQALRAASRGGDVRAVLRALPA